MRPSWRSTWHICTRFRIGGSATATLLALAVARGGLAGARNESDDGRKENEDFPLIISDILGKPKPPFPKLRIPIRVFEIESWPENGQG